jgi:outer membrane protein OmpA-like peptidoglycan-associated protein
VHVNASDPDNDPLTYSYSATGGAVDGTGADVRWNSSGVAVGTYTVNVKVDDGRGGTASCAADMKVEQKPNRPPTATLSIERSPIQPGERTGVTCNGTDPDNDPLTYSYSVTGGQIVGSGSNVQFDSTGAQPGTYTVTCTVNDGRGGTADASGTVEVKEPPQIKQLEAKLALHSIYFPTALPTVAKPNGGLEASQAATLDALASDFLQYLKYRPDAHLTLQGHADVRGPREYNVKLSERRADRAKNYLIDKGVPADHLQTQAFGFEKNMTDAEVKAQIDADPDLSPAEKKKILANLLTVRLASNRRVDITLSTTGEQSVRRFPFNSRDALTLLSRSGGEKGKTKAMAPAPKKKATP